MLFFIPMIVAIVLKVVSTNVFKDNHTLGKAWKYTLGTYSYYGILFLAYGMCLFCSQLKIFQELNVMLCRSSYRSHVCNCVDSLGDCLNKVSGLVRVFQEQIQKILTGFLFLSFFFNLKIANSDDNCLSQSRDNISCRGLSLLCCWRCFLGDQSTIRAEAMETTSLQQGISCLNISSICWSHSHISRLIN